MKVRELIEKLKEAPQEAEVRYWDADADEYLPVIGVLHSELNHEGEVELSAHETFDDVVAEAASTTP